MGLKAPPATLITRYEDAFFVLLPIPSNPKAKMVGNMIDMKKKEQYRAYNDIPSMDEMTSSIQIILRNAYNRNSLLGFSHFMVKLPVNLPNINKAIPPNARNWAACVLLMLESISVT